MEELLYIWLYDDEKAALAELRDFSQEARENMIGKAKAFAAWLEKNKNYDGNTQSEPQSQSTEGK